MNFFEPKTVKNQVFQRQLPSPSSRWCVRKNAYTNGIHKESRKTAHTWIPAVDACSAGRGDDNIKERGSVIIWIFVLIALFGALSFVISKGTNTGISHMTDQQVQLAATEILDYSRAIKAAVHELQISGCSDTEISFENNIVAGYTNPNSPSDESCHVFKMNGGGLTYLKPNKDWLDDSNTTVTHYKSWYTTAQNWIIGLGTDGTGAACNGGTSNGSCHELMTGMPFIKLDICKAINKKLGWGTDNNGTSPQDAGNSYGFITLSEPFIGNYVTTANMSMGDATPSNYSNIMTGCIEGTTNPAAGTYSFFQVLIVR